MLSAVIVDDEETVRSGLRRHYHWEKVGIEVLSDFAEGRAALEYLRNQPVDLLITDIVMPRMDGLELAREARALQEEIKIIFISGYSDTQYLWNALKMNAVDYIFKPVDFDELDGAVERVVHMVRQRSMEKEHIRELENQLSESRELLQQWQDNVRQVPFVSSGENCEALPEGDSSRLNAPIRLIRDYISAHYAEQLSIQSLAEMVYLTPTYLCVLFKKNTGYTLNEYITDVRLEAACRLLSRTNIRLQDICLQVGYLSPSYFSRLFRSRYGVSPSQYRASLLGEESEENEP